MVLRSRVLPAREATTGTWPLTLALLALLLVGLTALGPLLQGSDWWSAMALVSAVVLLGSALLRLTGARKWLVPVIALTVLLATLTLVFGQGSSLLWILPTPQTLGRFHELAGAGLNSIQQQATPAQPVDGILFLLALGAGLIAILMDILALSLRWAALAGLPMLIPVAAPGLLVTGGASVGTLILTAVAFLVLLQVDVRVRRAAEQTMPRGQAAEARAPVVSGARQRSQGPLRQAVAVGGIGIVGALVLSTATPALTEGSLIGTGGSGALFGSGVNSMIDLGRDLRRPDPVPALHYTTTANEQPYFKLATLDRFVGPTWVSSGPARTDNAVDEIEYPPGLSGDVKSTRATTSVVIDGVKTNWLPAPSPATGVEGLNGDWYWDTVAMSIGSPNSTTRGQQYTVTALELAPTREQLRDASRDYPADAQDDLELPLPRPNVIDETARDVTAGTGSPYEAAVALQDYLRGSSFTYDTEAPVEDGYDGGGVDVVGTFLEVRRGYCVHFASAMAVMARALGIPARISLGYLPGTPSSDGEPGWYNVDSHDLHSWPELYFVGVGWVPFEPTPGRGSVPEYALPAPAATDEATAAPSDPTAAPPISEGRQQEDSGSTSAPLGQGGESGLLLRFGLGLLGGLVVLAVPGVSRRIGRSRRRSAAGQGSARQAWRELRNTAIDHRLPVSDTQTPRELAGSVRAVIAPWGTPAGSVADATDALERILVALERERYDRPGREASPEWTGQLLRDLDRVLRAFHLAADPRERARAILVPASLWRSLLGALNRTAVGEG